ncbi:MAG: hypothetical protein ACLT4H_07030 [Bacteroides thetaiotaomicron]|jgi:hypothetical protein|uniref:hypothetical protein n=1 Tax=Bacteroides sp. AR20 TaxID=93974 RepID=UPI000B854274|nr:hypothetical protein [Bacteroides sp. AR20]
MKRIISYLHLKEVGVFELLFVMYPILSGYRYGNIPMLLVILLLLDVVAIYKGRLRVRFDAKYLKLAAFFVVFHETILFVTMKSIPSYFVNLYISYIVIFLSIYLVAPMLNYRKLIGSFSWIAIISIGGLLYQYMILLGGGSVTPIPLPFLPALDEGTRVYSFLNRPSSFFWEPQSFCSFMFVPLFLALYEKKMMWAIVITVSMFLSGSTTGIIISLLMLGVSVFSSDVNKTYKFLFVLFGVAMVYLLFNSSLFEAGVSKMEDTTFEENSRLFNGVTLVLRMPFINWITGVNYANVADYYFSGEVGSAFLLEKFDTIYMSTIWMILIKYGLIGTFLYVMTIVGPIKQCRSIYIYAIAIVVTMFSNPDYIGAMYAFEMIFIYAFVTNSKRYMQ